MGSTPSGGPVGASLEADLAAFGLRPEARPLEQLIRYIEELERWNRAINLTALNGPALVRRLIVEPLWVLRQLAPRGRAIDIGSGNGSPGIPWYVAGRFDSIDLIEARSRRATFLRQTVRRLGLTGVGVHRARFEMLGSGVSPANWFTLQGVRLSPALLAQIRQSAAQAATIVWFTGNEAIPASPTRVLEVPFSDRRALVFDL